jgi:hypothetical protein
MGNLLETNEFWFLSNELLLPWRRDEEAEEFWSAVETYSEEEDYRSQTEDSASEDFFSVVGEDEELDREVGYYII